MISNNMDKKYIILLVLSLVFLGVVFGLQSLVTVERDNIAPEVVKTTPPSAALDDSGQINEAEFQNAQKISADDSIDSIEKELNDTVILKEDFSDL